MATKLEPLVPLLAARQKTKSLAVPASQIVRLVLPTGLVLKYGVFDARGVHRCDRLPPQPLCARGKL